MVNVEERGRSEDGALTIERTRGEAGLNWGMKKEGEG